jgi:hypothetical protein
MVLYTLPPPPLSLPGGDTTGHHGGTTPAYAGHRIRRCDYSLHEQRRSARSVKHSKGTKGPLEQSKRKGHWNSLNTHKSKVIAVGGWTEPTTPLGINFHDWVDILEDNFGPTKNLSRHNSWTSHKTGTRTGAEILREEYVSGPTDTIR